MCAKDSRNNNNKRWGNKFIDKRNWKIYNEELVVRGEFLLPIDMFDNWYEELDKMNEGKKGRPYEFPESFIKIQAVWHQWVDYRGLEGIARSLERLCLIPYHDDFTTICRRINKLNINLEETLLKSTNHVSLAVDLSGIKVHNGGDWIRKVWKVKKGY